MANVQGRHELQPGWRARGFSASIWIFILVTSGWLAACADSHEPLPGSLYYLDGPREGRQVWRLEADGLTRAQLTHEEAGVTDFAVSQEDGRLAFVSANQLFLQDGDGGNRWLIADDRAADSQAGNYVFRGIVSDPVFSPDGNTLAYALDGLHLYDLASGQDEHVLTNLGHLLGETVVFVKENYAPGPWSPDGSQLLIIMGYVEGSTLAVMEPGAEPPFRRLRSHGPVCCYFNWTADSRAVLVANPDYTGDIPGLWRYDSQTGEERVIVPGLEEDGTINFVGWPYQHRSGELRFFRANLERFSPDEGIALKMVRSRADGSDLVEIRPEALHIGQVLWAEDGSLALVLGRRDGEEAWQVWLVRSDESPLQVLFEAGQEIRGLTWGP